MQHVLCNAATSESYALAFKTNSQQIPGFTSKPGKNPSSLKAHISCKVKSFFPNINQIPSMLVFHQKYIYSNIKKIFINKSYSSNIHHKTKTQAHFKVKNLWLPQFQHDNMTSRVWSQQIAKPVLTFCHGVKLTKQCMIKTSQRALSRTKAVTRECPPVLLFLLFSSLRSACVHVLYILHILQGIPNTRQQSWCDTLCKGTTVFAVVLKQLVLGANAYVCPGVCVDIYTIIRYILWILYISCFALPSTK